MLKIKIALIAVITIISIANSVASPGDTLSKPYLDATNYWLYGRTELAERSLRQVAAQAASTRTQPSVQLRTEVANNPSIPLS